MLTDDERAAFKKVYEAGRQAGLREALTALPRSLFTQFSAATDLNNAPLLNNDADEPTGYTAADATDYARYFSPDADGNYHGWMHRRFGLNPKQFATATGLTQGYVYRDGKHVAQWVPKPRPPRTFAAPGPPPRPNLVWKEETHRWINPHTGEEHEPEQPPPEPAKPPKKTAAKANTPSGAHPPKPDTNPPTLGGQKINSDVSKGVVEEVLKDPKGHSLTFVAQHLKNLKLKELQELKQRIGFTGGRTKSELVDKVLAHLKTVAPPAPKKPPAPKPQPGGPFAQKAAEVVAAAFADPTSIDFPTLGFHLKGLTIAELKELAKRHSVGVWAAKTKQQHVDKFFNALKLLNSKAQEKQQNADALAATKHFDSLPVPGSYLSAEPSQQWKKENPYANAKVLEDNDVDGVPNPALPDAARPPVPDKATAVAIHNYTWGYDGPLNAALRTTGQPPPIAANEHGKTAVSGPKMFADLQKAFAQTKPFDQPVKVYRGLRSLPPELVKNMEATAKKAMDSGGVVTMPGFISTSTNQDGAFKGPVRFTIHAVQGLDIKGYSHFPTEDELLINHNCQYRVKGVTRSGGQIHIELEQLSGGLSDPEKLILDGKPHSALSL